MHICLNNMYVCYKIHFFTGCAWGFPRIGIEITACVVCFSETCVWELNFDVVLTHLDMIKNTLFVCFYFCLTFGLNCSAFYSLLLNLFHAKMIAFV